MTVLNTQIAETINITENGQYDVARYTTANVSTPAAPAYYVEKAVDAHGKLINSGSSNIDFNGVTDLGDYALIYAYYKVVFPANTTINLGSLTKVTGSNACGNTFALSKNITTVNLGSLTSINGSNSFYHTFESCKEITSVDLSSLTTVVYAEGMFMACEGLTNINLSSLTFVTNNSACRYMFNGCSNLSNVNLDSLTLVSGPSGCEQMLAITKLNNVKLNSLKLLTANAACYRMFLNCTLLSSLSFPALNNSSFSGGAYVLSELVKGVTGCTIHFPKNLDPQSGSTVISSLYTYPNFGGTNTVLAFDLPSTVILTGANSQAYERSPKDDTATALAWRKQDTGTAPNLTIDWTPFYTSTLNDPSVGDTIYSDSACTTAVTTISSIA